MNTSWKSLLAALCLATLALPAAAQRAERAYAPEDLRGLAYNDQVRVISLEYQEQSNGRRIPDDQLRFYLDQVNRSNWGFSQIKSDIARSLGGSGGGNYPGPYPGGPGGGQLVRCESKDGDARRCPTQWQARPRLVRQLSKSPCIEGQTWNSQPGLITVWKGCRAEFAPGRGGWGGGGYHDDYSVTCSSVEDRTVTCAWNARYGQPRLIQQLSRAACVEGRTWGRQGRSAIWVSGGCRGRFGTY